MNETLRDAPLSVTPAQRRASNSFALPVASLFRRELIRFVRQPNRIVGSLGTPLIFWLLLTGGLGPAMRTDHAGSDPALYFLPGAIALVVLFTSIFSNLSLIEDRREGFLQSVLVAPISNLAIVAGKVLGGAAIAWLQGMLLLLLGAISGVRIPWSSVAPAAGAIALLALGLSALGFALAWRFDSVQAFHGIMNVVLMPMWVLSGAAFPISSSHIVLRMLSTINPMTYGLALISRSMGAASSVSFTTALLGSIAFTALASLAAARMIRSR